jgi:hypothetical protein
MSHNYLKPLFSLIQYLRSGVENDFQILALPRVTVEEFSAHLISSNLTRNFLHPQVATTTLAAIVNTEIEGIHSATAPTKTLLSYSTQFVGYSTLQFHYFLH